MDRNKDALTPLKDILESLFKDKSLPFNPEDANIWKLWDEIVGPAISKHAQPARIKNRKLWVHVSEPIWLQELEFQEETIKQRLNDRLGRKAVDKIEFRLGYM